VKHFTPAIDVKMGVIFKAELLLFHKCAVDFDLCFVFSEEFEQDTVIAFEVLVDSFCCFTRCFSQVCVVKVFTAYGAEDFICSSA
jgi:hypothetical protein